MEKEGVTGLGRRGYQEITGEERGGEKAQRKEEKLVQHSALVVP